ncbi:thioesterase family protein, partial [Clostridium sp.]
MLEAGIKGRQEVMVTDENSAAAVGSGLLPVFATPAMVALMEKTAWMSVAPYLN